MKTFVLTVSKQFPKTHIRAGESTRFVENIKRLFSNECEKIHTIVAASDRGRSECRHNVFGLGEVPLLET